LEPLDKFSMRFLVLFVLVSASACAQQSTAPVSDAELRYVVILTRHGVRSPTGKTTQLNQYSSVPWPQWNVPAGYLTAHGYELMRIFGAYDRSRFAQQGLLAAEGCSDAAHVSFLADSDQRTRETGRALAEGMFPGCTIEVRARPEGTNDPLFHPLKENLPEETRALAIAAIAGRIGGDPNNLAAAYRPQLEALDRILAGCGRAPDTNGARTSILTVPATLDSGSGDHLVSLHGPLNVSSTLSENLLLEYTEGMQGDNLGWGCLDEAVLRYVLQLHAAAADFTERTPAIAHILAAPLLDAILRSMNQAAIGKPVAGAPGRPEDRVLFLVGHDTNIAAVAGALNLTWIVDGRRDDTPPGGALLFELWRSRSSGSCSIRVEYTAQSLMQMRNAIPLTLANPPQSVPVVLPACGRSDGTCTLAGFNSALQGQLAAQSLP
jgi:4-phytase / acid phosphatase